MTNLLPLPLPPLHPRDCSSEVALRSSCGCCSTCDLNPDSPAHDFHCTRTGPPETRGCPSCGWPREFGKLINRINLIWSREISPVELDDVSILDRGGLDSSTAHSHAREIQFLGKLRSYSRLLRNVLETHFPLSTAPVASIASSRGRLLFGCSTLGGWCSMKEQRVRHYECVNGTSGLINL